MDVIDSSKSTGISEAAVELSKKQGLNEASQGRTWKGICCHVVSNIDKQFVKRQKLEKSFIIGRLSHLE